MVHGVGGCKCSYPAPSFFFFFSFIFFFGKSLCFTFLNVSLIWQQLFHPPTPSKTPHIFETFSPHFISNFSLPMRIDFNPLTQNIDLEIYIILNLRNAFRCSRKTLHRQTYTMCAFYPHLLRGNCRRHNL